MKIVAFQSNSKADEAAALREAYIMPDSALLQQGKPFFTPRFAERYEAYPQLALRIDRLGKTIAERFASRYIGAVAPALAVRAVEMRPEGLNGAFDGAAIVGQFIPVDEWRLSPAVSFSIDDRRLCDIAESDLGCSFERLVSFASNYFTLKMGDIIFTGSPAEPTALLPEMVVTATVGGERKLRCKIK